MKLGCNYSEELMTLIASNEVDVDFVKIGYFGPFVGLHDEVASVKPILIHGFGRFEHIGMVDPLANNDWEFMNETLTKYHAPPHLAVHFSIYDHDLSGVSMVRSRLEEGIKAFKDNLAVPPLVIENMDYNPMYNRDCVRKEAVDPEYISEICEKYDVAMLLDTAHASVSAYHLKMDIYDYIASLPLERVKEVHFVGTQMTNEQGLKDMHTPPLTPRDYDLLDWLKDRCSPDIITLEYGWPGSKFQWRTDKDAIKNQLGEIRKRF